MKAFFVFAVSKAGNWIQCFDAQKLRKVTHVGHY